MEQFSERLMQALRQNHMTQAQLADRTGISRPSMCQYCSGNFRPKPEKLHLIAAALGVSEVWLLGYDTEKEMSLNPENYPNLHPVRLKRFPILGEIACGEPIFAQEDKENFIMADADIHADFCLTAKGDSMIGARIYDGDTVFIRSQPTVENGEIAAVIIDDEATLKRVYFDRENERLQLIAENPAYAPLVYLGSELQYIRILGKAVAFMSPL